MKFEPTIDVKDVVRKASLYKKISQDDIDEFRENVEEFFGFVKIGQEERTQAGFLKTFLVNVTGCLSPCDLGTSPLIHYKFSASLITSSIMLRIC